jgi:hypothetical protein
MKNLLYIFLIFLSISCSTTKYIEVPVESVRIEYRDRFKYDSIYVKDSIIQTQDNDTIYLKEYKYIYKYINQTDTVLKIDSIPIVQIQEVIKEVNRLHNWQIILMVMGGGLAVLLGYKLIRLFKI